MSLSEMRELLDIARQIMDVLNGVTDRIIRVNREGPELRENLKAWRDVERLALRYLVLAQKMGLPPNVDGAIRKISQLIVTIRMLQISMNMMLATNPVTAAIGVAGLIGVAIDLGSGSLLEGY